MPRGRNLYFGVGVLILTGVALAVGFVLFLTSGRLGRDASIYETYLRESVTGLDVGAPVRYRGVAIGRVTEINLVSAVYAMSDMPPSSPEYQLVLLRFAVDHTRVGAVPSLEESIARGLRVRLASQGITGVLYLEIDFLDAVRFPVSTYPWEPRYPVVPSAPSTVAQVTSAAERLVQRLEVIDFEALIGNITGLAADLRHLAGSDDVSRVLRDAAETVTALRTTVESAEIPEVLAQIRSAARSVDSFATTAGNVVASPDLAGTIASANQAAADLRAAVARLPAAIQSLETTIRTARSVTSDTQADLVPLLRDLRAVAANLRDVTEALRRSPSQTLWGAPPPPDRR